MALKSGVTAVRMALEDQGAGMAGCTNGTGGKPAVMESRTNGT